MTSETKSNVDTSIPATFVPVPGLAQVGSDTAAVAAIVPVASNLGNLSIAPANAEQALHWQRLDKIADNSQVVLDKSDTGQGKSFGAMHLVQRMDGIAAVVCPSDLVSKWKKILGDNKIPFQTVMSYDSARVQKNRQESLMAKSIKWDENGKPLVAYGSDKFISWLRDDNNRGPKRRLVLIIDEYHNAKNSDTGNAILIRGLIRTVRDFNASIAGTEYKSARVTMLSATPFDKKSHAQGMLKLMGAFKADRLYETNPQGQITSTQGWSELVAYAQAVSKNAYFATRLKPENIYWVNSLNPLQPYSSATAMAWDVSTRIIDPAISSYMLSEDHKVSYNFFVEVASKEERKNPQVNEMAENVKKNIDDTLAEIATIIGFKEDESNTVSKNNKGIIAKLTRPFRQLEIYKCQLFIRTAYNILSVIPNSKVIVMLSYLESIDTIAYEFARVGIIPAVVKGSVSKEERDRIMEKFQEHNSDYRLLICNVQIVKQGRDLHDTSPGGKFPRYMLISPNYDMIAIVQAMGRIDRIGLTSVPNIRFIYTHTAKPELRIISSLIRKGEVLGTHRGLTVEEVEAEGKGTTSARKRVSKKQEPGDVGSLNESTGDDEETTAEVGSRSNPLPGNFMCQVEGLVDSRGLLKVVPVDEARRYLLEYYGMTPAQALDIVNQSGLADIGAKSSRKKPSAKEKKAASIAPDGKTALPVSLKKPEPVYAPPQAIQLPSAPVAVSARTQAIATGSATAIPFVPPVFAAVPQSFVVPGAPAAGAVSARGAPAVAPTTGALPVSFQPPVSAALPVSFLPPAPAAAAPAAATSFVPPSFQPPVSGAAAPSFVAPVFNPPTAPVPSQSVSFVAPVQPQLNIPLAFLPPQLSARTAVAPSGAPIQPLGTTALPVAVAPPPLPSLSARQQLGGLTTSVSTATNL